MQKRITIKLDKIVLIAVILLFLVLIAQLSRIVLSKELDGIDLTAFANNRNEVRKTLYATRGSIFDVKGNLLAQQVNSYTLIAYLEPSRTTDPDKPQHVVDKRLTAEKLSPIINTSVDDIMNILNKDAYQVEFGKNAKNLTEVEKKAIEELDLPGIDFISSSQRYYKMGTFASYIIGYTKKDDNGKLSGEMGIEKYLNDKLEGVDGFKEYQRDAYGYQMPNTPSNTQDAVPGYDVYLTIDNNIQILAENALYDLAASRTFEWATLSIMEADTGAIVASADYPTFNLNDLSTINSYLDPLVSYQYEPGSTMKMYSFMAAMEEGIYNGDATYHSGCVEVADATICDFNKKGWGDITYDTGFAYSSNTASLSLGLKLGTDKLKAYYKKFGFGSTTGIELPNEQPGKINFKYKSELANASFGQGITTTPVQNLQGLSFIANDGMMLKPYIVDKIVDSNGNIIEQNGRTELGQVVKPETAIRMRELMHDVVYNGLVKAYRTENVSLIGKTGTAQIASPKGGYLSGQYDNIKSFAGMFPEEDPKYIVYFSVKDLVGTTTDMGKVLKPLVEEIAKYANITTTKSDLNESMIITVPNFITEPVTKVSEYAKNNSMDLVLLGSGEKTAYQYPVAGKTTIAGSKLFILSNNNDYTMPDVSGWSTNEVTTLCKLLNIKYTLNGYGYVKSVNIEPGAEINADTELVINLE